MAIKYLNMVWSCKHIRKRSDLCVLLALADWSDDEGRSYPSLNQLARKSRMSKSTCVRTLKDMRDRYVKWKANSGGRNMRNQYLLIEKALLAGEAPPLNKPVKGVIMEPFTDGSKGCQNERLKGVTMTHAINHQDKPPFFNNTNTKIPHTLSSTPREESERKKDIDLSFLPEKDRIYSGDIRAAISAYPPDFIAQAYVHILRGDHRGATPTSALIQLQAEYGHTKLVAALVYAKAENNGGASLKFVEGVIKRWNRMASTVANTRPEVRFWQPAQYVEELD